MFLHFKSFQRTKRDETSQVGYPPPSPPPPPPPASNSLPPPPPPNSLPPPPPSRKKGTHRFHRLRVRFIITSGRYEVQEEVTILS